MYIKVIYTYVHGGYKCSNIALFLVVGSPVRQRLVVFLARGLELLCLLALEIVHLLLVL